MLIYLAGPFFKTEQYTTILNLERLLEEAGVDYYSPRKDGVLVNMTPEERKASAKRIFAINVAKIKTCDVVVAVVDDRDPGTTWELGYASCLKHLFEKPVILTYTAHDYGLNVMIQECVDAHARSLADLRKMIDRAISGKNLSEYRNFSDKVF